MFVEFKIAREFAHSLGLINKDEWATYVKSNIIPDNIPKAPRRVYLNKGWKGWGDFLGTGNLSPSNKSKNFFSYEQAKAYVRKRDFKNQKEFRQWAKSKNRPTFIPVAPWQTYAGNGWISLGDFIGTDTIALKNKKFRSFDEARKFARSLRLKSKGEWQKFVKTDKMPKDIPVNPEDSYKKKGWISWGDFLGTGTIAPKNKIFCSFNEAKLYVQNLKFKSKKELFEWSQRPNYIPGDPSKVYTYDGWSGWGDFLGTRTIANHRRIYRPFEKARSYIRSLKLKNQAEWKRFRDSGDLPSDIPRYPNETYANKGWNGMGDWLGVENQGWTIEKIRSFVASVLPYLSSMTEAELYILCQQTGLLDIAGCAKGKAFVQAFKTGKFPQEELERFINNEPSLADRFFENPNHTLDAEEDLLDAKHSISENDLDLAQGELNVVATKDVLTALDSKIYANLDREAIDFFIKSAVAKIWHHAYKDESVAIEQLKQYDGDGVYPQEVRRLFLQDYEGAKQLEIPAGYSFAYQPSLMQRYTAYLVQSRKRIGNWSGTGAGKTLSAILASRIIEAKLTVICCPNNVIDHWVTDIKATYPDSLVYAKASDIKKIDTQAHHNYFILNYEFFQRPKAKQELENLLSRRIVDLVVIDEIHFSKQREAKQASIRKSLISWFLSAAAAFNSDLHVLGMSATPVINNLFEGKTLIELVTGVLHDEMGTKPTVSNCISMYQKFISQGIRWIPDYHYKMNVMTPDIDCGDFLPEIKRVSAHGSIVDLEVILTKAKIPFILQNLQPKTLIYTHYVTGTVHALQQAIEQNGWRVSVFTGDNKEGLYDFVQGDADILIASSCIGTGVDGLQQVCNRVIISCLPWTHAEYKQLIGRIYRQGQKKDQVDVIIPITYAEVNGQRWSWCDSRWKRIQFKKSISDAAVDGVIPEGHLRTPAQAHKDILLWLERLEKGEIYEVERKKISIALNNVVDLPAIRKIGDLSRLNQGINKSTSQETHQRFLNNSQEWHDYHAAYRETRKEWEVIPYQEAIKWCKVRPQLVIGDFGCGEAFLTQELNNNKVYSFDYVAINENVIACDMARVPLDEASLDVAIFSLSLMGTNYIDYLREAHRCLKLDGHLWIAEPTSRIKDIELFKELLERLGFDVRRIHEKWKFTFIEALKSDRRVNQQVVNDLNQKIILD